MDSKAVTVAGGRWDLLIRCEKGKQASDDAVWHVMALLKGAGLHVDVEYSPTTRKDGNKRALVKVRAPFDLLAAHAELLRFPMPTKLDGTSIPFERSKMALFVGGDEHARTCRSNVSASKDELADADHEASSFFSSTERARLVTSLVEQVKTSSLSATYIPNCAGEGVRLLDACQRGAVVESFFPLHDKPEKLSLRKEFMRVWGFSHPINRVRAYFGEGVALYFAWMDTYCMWLTFPAAVGVLVWLIDSANMDTSVIMPTYAALVIVWAALFLRFWERASATYAHTWNTRETKEKADLVRLAFYGEPRKSPVTGAEEVHFPLWKRRVRQLCSGAITLMMLTVALGVMFVLLNLQGLSEPGAFGYIHPLDGLSGRLHFVPSLLHVVLVLILNRIYRGVAMHLTEWENYRTVSEHEDALIFKRFLFESLDCYLPLLYVGFIRRDVGLLHEMLTSLHLAEEIRRVITETAIPWLMKQHRVRSKGRALAHTKKADGGTAPPQTGWLEWHCCHVWYTRSLVFHSTEVSCGIIVRPAMCAQRTHTQTLGHTCIELRIT
eukprot:Opistho-2@11958